MAARKEKNSLDSAPKSAYYVTSWQSSKQEINEEFCRTQLQYKEQYRVYQSAVLCPGVRVLHPACIEITATKSPL